MSAPTLGVIVLAAGASTRFGSAKQLATIAGVPMLQRVAERALAVVDQPVSVVLGAHAPTIAATLKHLPVSIVICQDWSEGMAASLRAGIGQLPGRCDAALLLLADQVAVTSTDLRRLVETWRGNPQAVVAAQYNEGCGVPAIFPRDQFPQLLALRGAYGARSILRQCTVTLLTVPMPNAALDIDTPADLERANRISASCGPGLV
jgi:molybdenum cofactor cytidylyltransferase